MKSGDEGSDFTWSWEIFFQATLAGILMDSGRILIGMAVAVGQAGPAQALMSTHSLYQVFWSFVLDGQGVSTMQAIGLALGISSVMTLSLADKIEKCFACEVKAEAEAKECYIKQ